MDSSLHLRRWPARPQNGARGACAQILRPDENQAEIPDSRSRSSQDQAVATQCRRDRRRTVGGVLVPWRDVGSGGLQEAAPATEDPVFRDVEQGRNDPARVADQARGGQHRNPRFGRYHGHQRFWLISRPATRRPSQRRIETLCQFREFSPENRFRNVTNCGGARMSPARAWGWNAQPISRVPSGSMSETNSATDDFSRICTGRGDETLRVSAANGT